MKDVFEKEILNVKHKVTVVPMDLETNSQKMRTFGQKYYFCTLKKTM
jgi:hypothetical protein